MVMVDPGDQAGGDIGLLFWNTCCMEFLQGLGMGLTQLCLYAFLGTRCDMRYEMLILSPGRRCQLSDEFAQKLQALSCEHTKN